MRIVILQAILDARTDPARDTALDVVLGHVHAHLQVPNYASRTASSQDGAEPVGFAANDVREHLADCMDIASHLANLLAVGSTYVIFSWWLNIFTRKLEHLCWMHFYFKHEAQAAPCSPGSNLEPLTKRARTHFAEENAN